MASVNGNIALSNNSNLLQDSRVEDFLNDKLQTIGDLDGLDILLEGVLKQQALLAQQLQEVRKAREDAVSKSTEFRNDLHARTQKFQRQQADIDRRLKIVSQSETSDEALREFGTTVSKLHDLEVAQGYFDTLKEVERLSEETRAHLSDPEHQNALQLYLRLKGLVKELKEAQVPAEGAAIHLVLQVENLAEKIWTEMRDEYARRFEVTLKEMKWPEKDTTLSENLASRWEHGVVTLLDIQRSYLESTTLGDGSLEGDAPVLLPLQVMMKPLELRFEYHFQGDRPTNKIDKPEYFLSHAVGLLNTYDAFFATYLQPVLHRYFRNSSLSLVSVFQDSTSALVSAVLPMLRRKLSRILPQLSSKPDLLSHLIHEVMSFDTSVREEWCYDGGNVVDGWMGLTWDILVKHSWFSQWLTVEKNFALSRYQEIVEASDSFEIDRDSDSSATSKPTFAAIRVMDLLEAVTEDYRPLMSFHHKLQFLIEIQMGIFDMFYNRLDDALIAFQQQTSAVGRIQGASRETQANLFGIGGLERLCRIYGSADFLEGKMRDWSDDVFFVELWDELQSRMRGSGAEKQIAGPMTAEQVAERTSKALASDDGSGSLFDETAGAYRRLRVRAEDAIQDKLIYGVREALRPYARLNAWDVAKHPDTGSLTPTAVLDSTQTYLAEHLLFLSKVLTSASLRRIGRQTILAVQTFLWDKVVARKVFSTAGAAQFRRDIESIISTCDKCLGNGQAERGMGRLKEALVLLELPDEHLEEDNEREDGVEIGLWEVERRIFEDNESARQTLEELGIMSLNASDARDVLRRRIELQD